MNLLKMLNEAALRPTIKRSNEAPRIERNKIVKKVEKELTKELYLGEWRNRSNTKIANLYYIPGTQEYVVKLEVENPKSRSSDFKSAGPDQKFKDVNKAISTMNEFFKEA
jgi:hypothetical protein